MMGDVVLARCYWCYCVTHGWQDVVGITVALASNIPLLG
jgi:hypothetical protein